MVRYHVVEASTVGQLELDVEEYSNHGYRPLGGMDSDRVDASTVTYRQAMVANVGDVEA